MKRFALTAALLLHILIMPGCTADGIVGGDSAPETEAVTFSPANAFADVVCSAEEALKWAKENPVAISGEICAGHEVIETFFDTINAGNPASVLCAKYYELHPESMSAELYEAEKDQYPVLYFCLVEYDGTEYHVKVRSSSGTELDSEETYQHLVHLTGGNPAGALKKFTDEYDLTDDPNVTFEQIQRSLYSSHSGDYIRHKALFTDFHD